MTYRGKQDSYNGTNLRARTVEIERLAVAGVYHYDIAKRLGLSPRVVEDTMALLRSQGRIGSMRGPRKNVVGIDWEWAASVWRDHSIPGERAVELIGCSQNTIYRKLGVRGMVTGPRATTDRTLTMTDSSTDLILQEVIRRRDAAQAEARLWCAVVERLTFQAQPPQPATAAAPPSNAELVRTASVIPPAQELARELAAASVAKKEPPPSKNRAGPPVVTIAPGVTIIPSLADRWTPERVLFLRRHVPTDRVWLEIWDGFHKLPGVPCPTIATLHTFCNQKLGIKRLGKQRVFDPLIDGPPGNERKTALADKLAPNLSAAPVANAPKPAVEADNETDKLATDTDKPAVSLSAGPQADPDPPRLPPMEDTTKVTSMTVSFGPNVTPEGRAAMAEAAEKVGLVVENEVARGPSTSIISPQVPSNPPNDGHVGTPVAAKGFTVAGRGKNGWLTIDREMRLRALCKYPGTLLSHIFEALSPLPGPPIPSRAEIVGMLSELKLTLLPGKPIADEARTLGYEPSDPFVRAKPAVTIIAPAPPAPKPKPPPPPPVRPNLGPPRLAKALELPVPLPPTTEPIEADAATIRATVSAWGLGFRGEMDMRAVNDAAHRRGARPFRLIETVAQTKRRKCLRCEKLFVAKSKDNWICVTCLPTVSSGVEGA